MKLPDGLEYVCESTCKKCYGRGKISMRVNRSIKGKMVLDEEFSDMPCKCVRVRRKEGVNKSGQASNAVEKEGVGSGSTSQSKGS